GAGPTRSAVSSAVAARARRRAAPSLRERAIVVLAQPALRLQVAGKVGEVGELQIEGHEGPVILLAADGLFVELARLAQILPVEGRVARPPRPDPGRELRSPQPLPHPQRVVARHVIPTLPELDVVVLL